VESGHGRAALIKNDPGAGCAPVDSSEYSLKLSGIVAWNFSLWKFSAPVTKKYFYPRKNLFPMLVK